MATALVTGLTGRLIDFFRYINSREDINNLDLINTKAGMTVIFKRMLKGRKERYDYIIPWKILEDLTSNRSE
jgi:hypothetical protein